MEIGAPAATTLKQRRRSRLCLLPPSLFSHAAGSSSLQPRISRCCHRCLSRRRTFSLFLSAQERIESLHWSASSLYLELKHTSQLKSRMYSSNSGCVKKKSALLVNPRHLGAQLNLRPQSPGLFFHGANLGPVVSGKVYVSSTEHSRRQAQSRPQAFIKQISQQLVLWGMCNCQSTEEILKTSCQG